MPRFRIFTTTHGALRRGESSIGGTADATLYGTFTGSPNSAGWIFELAYLPFSHGGPSFWPWLNFRVGLQYTHWNKFDGATTNINGIGQKREQQQYDLCLHLDHVLRSHLAAHFVVTRRIAAAGSSPSPKSAIGTLSSSSGGHNPDRGRLSRRTARRGEVWVDGERVQELTVHPGFSRSSTSSAHVRHGA